MTVTADPIVEGSAAAAEEEDEEETTSTNLRSSVTTTAHHRNQTAMSLTYSDFLYVRNGYDYDEEISTVSENRRDTERRLPADFKPIQETKVPLMQVEDHANHDFIIIAEFSEQEGPVPLCTVPKDAAVKTDIKLSDFVVHLMSTDYLVNTVGQFRICKDTQVMRKNVFPNVHVFMQYFTLYDLKARGFVRPFCFGYVSKDHIKLDKYINFFMTEFGKITSVLEHCNRQWFANELESYLQKLENAKEACIMRENRYQEVGVDLQQGNIGVDVDEHNDEHVDQQQQHDTLLDSDTITLAQIAHQYSEIKNILTIVQNFEHSNHNNHAIFNSTVLSDITSFFTRFPEFPIAQFFQRTCGSSRFSFDSTSSSSSSPSSIEAIPLVHPLRFKGEALRPLTVLGQAGSVFLVGKLMQIHGCCKMDIIFTEMSESTVAFRQHFANLCVTQANNNNNNVSSPGRSSGISVDFDNSVGGGSNNSESNTSDSVWFSSSSLETGSPDHSNTSMEILSPFELLLEDNKNQSCQTNSHNLWSNYMKKELYEIIEKLHLCAPFSSSDSKSGSYHTVSEEEEELSDKNNDCAGANCDVSTLNSTIEMRSFEQRKASSEQVVPPQSLMLPKNNQIIENDNFKLNSFSSDEDISLQSSSPSKSLGGTSEEIIMKEPWWVHASKKLVGGVPGYGLASFFRRYHATAHHILYSILLGRPIIICGESKMSRKIGKIITSLIPLVPLPPNSEQHKSWKLLRWHQGIIVQSHIESYRLIGLCIPEKLEVLDLIPSRLVNLVTILSADNKAILGGPAYSGDLLQSFEKKMQRHFSNSDVSLLSYIGGLYADIEAKVYMYKSLVMDNNSKGGGTGKGKSATGGNNYSILKELNLRASDVEIVKYLSNLISDPRDCVNIL